MAASQQLGHQQIRKSTSIVVTRSIERIIVFVTQAAVVLLQILGLVPRQPFADANRPFVGSQRRFHICSITQAIEIL